MGILTLGANYDTCYVYMENMIAILCDLLSCGMTSEDMWLCITNCVSYSFSSDVTWLKVVGAIC
jgi:hypothetical protein